MGVNVNLEGVRLGLRLNLEIRVCFVRDQGRRLIFTVIL